MSPRELQGKLRTCWYIILGLMFVLIIKLAYVQFVQSDQYITRAQKNSVRLVNIRAPRGEIYDREGKILVKNRQVYTVSLTYLKITDREKVTKHLAELMNPVYPEITPDYINELIEEQRYRLFEPITVMRDVDWAMVVKLEENRSELPGVEIIVEPLRYYPENSLAGHLLGYVHPIYDSKELDQYDESLNYRIGDLVGKDGLERFYQDYLRGTDGARRVEVDARGRPIRELVTQQPKTGDNLVLTLDRDLQRVMEIAADEVFEQLQTKYPKAKAGSFVLLDVKTGGVLALCSRPGLDPNVFTKNMGSEEMTYYFPQGNYDPLNPGAASNRAIKSVYPPGSTFKPITGMAALASGKLDPYEDYANCKGAYWIAPYIGCWGVHGPVNYFSGLAVSCNVYFQEAGRRAGSDLIAKVAREFGLGTKTSIDLPYEQSGLVPDAEWKKEINGILLDRRYDRLRKELDDKHEALIDAAETSEARQKAIADKEKASKALEAQYKIDYKFGTTWHPYDTFNMSIGQGDNHYTVMQLANFVATIANDGKRMQPYLVDKIVSPSGNVIKEFKPQVIHEVDLDPEILEITREAMHSVAVPGGTAAYIFSKLPLEISGGAKTGTAQTGRTGDNKNRDYHGVFIAYAPYDDPQIAFAGLVEYGYHGSTSAGLVAKAVFEHYFGVEDKLANDLPATVNEEELGNIE
ncbi:MAG: penicillin-binding protein 2 [Syntrophomonadaceae bacterium]|nr:penicillin-binding protein 2 [Syntrophomonadaceae bacterium]